MREPVRQVLDEAEKRHSDPQAAYREVQARLEKPASRRSLVLGLASASAAALMIVGLGAVKLTQAPQQMSLGATTLKGRAVDDGPDTAALLGMCKSFSDPDGNVLDWSRAIDACQKVLTWDPINVDARRLEKLSEKELAQKKLFDSAHRLFDLGEANDAMGEYLKVDSDSSYFRQARSEFQKAAPIALTVAGDRCVVGWRAGTFDAAWPDCRQMMDLAAYLGFKGSANGKLYEQASEAMSAHFKGNDTWVPRQEFARFLKGDASAYSDRRYEAIKKMYLDPDLAEAVNRYALDPTLGMQSIQRYIGKGGKHEAQAKEVYRHMEVATGSHQAGYEELMGFDLEKAAADFRAQLESDAKALPPGFESDLSKATRQSISEAFAKRGKELFQEGRFPDSFQQCEGGAEFLVGNPSILECYSDLENKAAGLVERGCPGLEMATKITRKESPTHKKAVRALKDGC